MAIIQIKPIEVTKWHGKSKEKSFTRPKTIQAFVDPHSMQYRTGLNYEDVNENYKVDGKPATEAAYYESILKLDLSNNFVPGRPHPFWDEKISRLVLENKTIVLDTRNPLNYIKYKIAKACEYVANSLKEYDDGHFPNATHYIYSEEEEVEVVAKKIEQKEQAREKISKMTLDQKIQLVLLLTGAEDYTKVKNLKGKSENFLKVELERVIENAPHKILEIHKLGKEALSTRALVLEALSKGVFTKEGVRIMYHDSVVGSDVTSAAEYLADPINQDFKLRIVEKLA